MDKQLYCSGDLIPESGIYGLSHEGHTHNHRECLLLKGDSFPACELCGDGAKFKPIHLAPYILTDADFGYKAVQIHDHATFGG